MKNYKVLGLMSGTSLDGVDLALCSFTTSEVGVNFELIAAETIKYPYYLWEKLNDALHLSAQNLHELDQELGAYYSDLIIDFNNKHGITPDLVSSHGHTILHQPHKGITLQLGDGDVMAQKTRIRVINDFRIQDVSKGGQGAPLVPVGDRDLFGDYDMCLNLGGIANISYNHNNNRIACDISPCNMALNTITAWIDMEFDNKGNLASRGNINETLLLKLNSLPYYQLEAPKSIGKEWFVHEFLPVLRKSRINIEDALRTVTEHIAETVSDFINRNSNDRARVLVTGGGSYNSFLLNRLIEKTQAQLILPSNDLIEFKEAIVFAYLGLLRLEGKVNTLASVTGASSDTSSGIINNPN